MRRRYGRHGLPAKGGPLRRGRSRAGIFQGAEATERGTVSFLDQTYGVREPLEVAAELLRQSGAPMTARALLVETLKALGQDESDAALLAELHTEISLDYRFLPAAHGTWGLREWLPKPKPARVGKVALEKRTKSLIDDDDAGEASEDWD